MSISKQQLQEIGTTLHDARLEQNLTLETVAAETLIAKRVLIAIEQANVKELPETIYLKALIGKYALKLGIAVNLKDDEIVEERDLENSNPEKEARSPNFPTVQLKQTHLYGIYLILVVFAVGAIANLVERPVVVDNSTMTQEDVALDNPQTIDNDTPTTISSISPSQFVSQSNSNNSDSVVVDITLKDRCWLKVMVDGKVEFEGTLAKGTQRSWTGREQINIIAGNAGGVVITYNHGQEKLLGKPGQVEEVTYTVN